MLNFRFTHNFGCLISTQRTLTVAANATEQKTNRFKMLDDHSAACSNQLLWLVENDWKNEKKMPFLQFKQWVSK